MSSTVFSPKDALHRVIEHREIFHEEMISLMRQIMRGEVSPVMTAGILIGLRVKKETIGEIAAAAEVMREFATPVAVPDKSAMVDLCGTGGDGSHSLNISTAVAIVVAACEDPTPTNKPDTASNSATSARPTIFMGGHSRTVQACTISFLMTFLPSRRSWYLTT